MARILGGIGASHAPSLAFAQDAGKQNEPEWKEIFDAYHPAHAWLREKAPDTVVLIYNDHMNTFCDIVPSIAISVGETNPVIDEGWGKRPFPDCPNDPEMAWHLVNHLVAHDFDITTCMSQQVDHGMLTPITMLFEPPWPVRIIGVSINAVQHPLPSPRRCWNLGREIRRAIESYDNDAKVVVLGTGGLSHQTTGSGFGHVNPDWDQNFMTLLETEPETLADYTQDEIMILGGAESVEVVNWICMRGALSDQVRRVHRFYAAPMLTGYGLLVLDEKLNEES